MSVVLSAERVSRRFGGLWAVRDVSLEVRQGEFLSIIGPNGAGKTTLFNIFTGFMAPTGGQVYINGQPVVGKRPDQICKMGVVRTFQLVRPFQQLTVYENVFIAALHSESSRKRAAEWTDEVLALTGLATSARKVASDLPYARRKTVELARAIATHPSVILLDEVLAGLSQDEVEMILGTISRLREQGVTTVAGVEHIMRIVMRVSDRIAVLHHGEKLAEGTPDEITSDPRVVEAYLGRHYARG